MIYAIQAGQFYKFGYTHRLNLSHRIKTMQTGCPFELVLLAACEGDRTLEQYIHLRLRKAGAHYRGEWFRWCEEAEQIVKHMLSKDISEEKALPPAGDVSGHRLGRVLRYNSMIVTRPDGNGLVPGRV